MDGFVRNWLFWFCLCGLPRIVLALPSNPQTIAGESSFAQSGSELHVTATDRAILHWEAFSIQGGERVSFQLPSTQAAILNRVTGGNPTEIFGTLQSNGNVYLINPQGIFIGKEGMIQTGAFLASTLDISNRDFLENKELLFQGNSDGKIANDGQVLAELGDVVFIAGQIANMGSIAAPRGAILFGAGKEITYCPYSDRKVQIRLSPRVKTGEEPVGILQEGTLQAKRVELKADGNWYSYAIRNEGIIEAASVEERGGEIWLVAEDGVVRHSGSLKADEIRVLGQHIRVVDEAVIDASNSAGGGTVLIGGDYQGGNPEILNAYSTLVEENVVLSADGLVKGDGGRIIVWADGTTGFYGTVNANGGPAGGDGGFIEISGKEALDFKGLANTAAPQGKWGNLLLDPSNTTISGGVDANVTFTACPTGTYEVTANTAVINATSLVTNLGSTCDITISTAAAGSQAGTLTISSPVVWSSERSLTLNATSGITVNANVQNTSNAASLTFNSGTTTGSTLTIASGVTVSLTGSGVSPTGTLSLISNAIATSDITINGAISVTDKALVIAAADDFTLAATTGSIIFDAVGKTFDFSTVPLGGSVSTFNGPVTITNGDCILSTPSTGTLAINAPFINNGTGSVLMDAGGSLTTAVAGTITTAAGSGNLTLNSGTTATFNGAITHNATAANFSVTAGTTAAFNANVVARPASSTGTTSVTGGTTVGGGVTIAAGTTFSHNSSGAATFTAAGSVGAGSDITVSGTLTVNGANLTMTVDDDFTLTTGTGAINYNSPGKTFTLSTNSTSGSAVNLAGAVTITDGNVDWNNTGGTLTISNLATLGTGTIDCSCSTTLTGTTVNHQSTGNLIFTSTAGDITLNGTCTIPNSNATFFPDDDFTLTAAGTMNFSAPGKLLYFQRGTSTSDTFTGVVNVTGGNMTVDAFDDITISATTGSITYNVSGGTLSFTSTGGADPDFALNGMLSVPAGILQIATFDDITFGAGSTFTYASPSAMTFTANPGAIAWNGTSTISNGTLTMTAVDTISFGTASSTTYTSPLPWSMSTDSGITINGPISLTTAADWTISSGGILSINNLARNFSTGDILATADLGCVIGFSANTTSSRLGTAGGLTSLVCALDCSITASSLTPGATAFLGFTSGGQTGEINAQIDGNFVIAARGNNDAAIECPGILTLDVGAGLVIEADSLRGSTGNAFIQCAGSGNISAQDIHFTGAHTGGSCFIEGQSGSLVIVSQEDILMFENCFIRNTGPGKLVLVVDEQAPLPPAVGNGQLVLIADCFLSTNGGELSIYTASPAQNLITGLINGATLAEGNQVYGVYYSLSGEDPPPFTIFYKVAGSSTAGLSSLIAQYNVAVAEMIQETFIRAMGWEWRSPFWTCNLPNTTQTVWWEFYRKPFEYPLLLKPVSSPCDKKRV